MTNQDLLNIAQEFEYMVYVYDADSIKTQYEKLKTSFGEQTKFSTLYKSLTNINILKYVEKISTNLDCVSINEVKLGLKAGFSPENLSSRLIV